MWTILVLAICEIVSASEFETEDNGWIPVSSDVVYQQIQHGLAQPPRYTKVNNVQSLYTDTEMLSFLSQEYKNEEHKAENTRTDSEKQISQGFAYFNDNKPSSEYENKFTLKKGSIPMKKGTGSGTQAENEPDNIVRKSKKLLFDESFSESNENINIIEEKSAEDYSHTYEVTENINVEDEIDQEETIEKSGYEYNPPDTKNLKNDLIKHLFKYNIKENDNLQNYAISRRPKVVNPPRKVEYQPLHLKAPFRYNNLNHLPVDPLLAVFLSNYGYYLQGQYGIQNNYNNLYGYLASNNIHNNRPFGHYKLFSDTDSSE